MSQNKFTYHKGEAVSGRPTVLCFSHLRWKFVYQRPQHLLTRAAGHADVFVLEEPVALEVSAPELRSETQEGGVRVLTPVLPHGMHGAESVEAQRELLDAWLAERKPERLIAWYYTPMALAFSNHLMPEVTVYDCMDELSAFQGAPREMLDQEQRLFARADVVFAGGRSLYEAKSRQHGNVHLFASSIDYEHFSGAGRNLSEPQNEPEDQRGIPHPRIGFFGVLDERLDRELLREVAACEPSWHFVLIGPVVKIREDELPRASNLHYLGAKAYAELPRYLAHWDVAMLPFALNESTRFISPTKTPEYLAAGKPVVSTPIRDVVEPYGRLGLARIAGDSKSFCEAVKASLEEQDPAWKPAVEKFLRQTSWDRTFAGMWAEVMRCEATEAEDARDTEDDISEETANV